ncbi:MAG: formyl transferase [Candidatus Aenigmarchaeota archaeon]|nr:formyl transferase [Candidatus Aenigmarchaeota archaeon]
MVYARAELKKLYDPEILQRPMRVVELMSGSGTNVVKTLEHQNALAAARGKSPYEVVAIFTDNKGSKAEQIAAKFSLPFECEDMEDFYREYGHPNKRDLSLRTQYFERVVRRLEQYKPDTIVLGGFMSIVTEPLLSAWLGINVHPADLSIIENERRKYTGDKAVRDQILDGEPELRSSTHIVRHDVDYGEVLMVSGSVPVDLEKAAMKLADEGLLNIDLDPRTFDLEFLRDPKNRRVSKMIADKHQDWLKEKGDWVILPQTVEWIADGRFAMGRKGIYVDSLWVPNGYRLETSN